MQAREAALKVLEKRFSYRVVSTRIASEAHRVIREVSRNPDPFAAMKKSEIGTASELFVAPGADADLESLASLAVLGNAIDFFVDHETLSRTLTRPVLLAVDDLPEFARKVRDARTILYLADNAGECFFDLPLVRYLRDNATVAYVVRGSAVQNDLTVEDLRLAGLEGQFGPVITTGNDFVGVDLETASPEFVRAFKGADVIVAKGMGNYETISELRPEGRVMFLLKAKCRPVADSLGVPLNACVAKMY